MAPSRGRCLEREGVLPGQARAAVCMTQTCSGSLFAELPLRQIPSYRNVKGTLPQLWGKMCAIKVCTEMPGEAGALVGSSK